MSNEFTEALPYSISEESQTDSTSRHLGDINFAFQFAFFADRVRVLYNAMVFLLDIYQKKKGKH